MKKLIFVALAAIFTLSGMLVMAQPPQGGARGQKFSPEQRVEQLQKQLKLTDEQCDQILKFQEKRTMPERGNREAMQKAMAEEKAQMKKILTEKQYKKWERSQPQRGSQGGGNRPQRQ